MIPLFCVWKLEMGDKLMKKADFLLQIVVNRPVYVT